MSRYNWQVVRCIRYSFAVSANVCRILVLNAYFADINFTVVRPPGLGKEGPTELEIKEAVGCQTVTGTPAGRPMQRGDVARFLMKALTCGAYDRKMVAIST